MFGHGMCVILPSYKKVNKDKPVGYIHATVTDLKYECHICDEFGHEISINANVKETVHYFACKMFVQMSQDEQQKSSVPKQIVCSMLRTRNKI